MIFCVLCVDYQITDPRYAHLALKEMETTLSTYRDVKIVKTFNCRMNAATRRIFVEFFHE